jgi:hypothetical protein
MAQYHCTPLYYLPNKALSLRFKYESFGLDN